MNELEFTRSDFQKSVMMTDGERQASAAFFSDDLNHTTNALFHRVGVRYEPDEAGESRKVYAYSLLPSSMFAYLDLMEMQQAHANALQSTKLAEKAIDRSTIAIYVSVVIGLLQLYVSVCH